MTNVSYCDDSEIGENSSYGHWNFFTRILIYCKTRSQAMSDEESKGGGGGGWMVWIGILLLINLLSWALDWSFWLY